MEYRNGLGTDADLKTLTLADRFKINSSEIVSRYKSFAETGFVNYDFSKFLTVNSIRTVYKLYSENTSSRNPPHTKLWVWYNKLGKKIGWDTIRSLDNIFTVTKEVNKIRQIYDTKAYVRRAGMHPAQYFYNLDIESDPVMYLRKLACWKAAGLCLDPKKLHYDVTPSEINYLKGNLNQSFIIKYRTNPVKEKITPHLTTPLDDHSITNSPVSSFKLSGNYELLRMGTLHTYKQSTAYSHPLVNTERDSAIYGAYILRFAEKLVLTALGSALDYRQYAEIDDENTLNNAYQVLIDSKGSIRSAMEEVFTIKILSEDKNLWGYVTSGIPDFGSVTLPGIGNFTFKKALIVLWEQYYLPLIESSLNIIGARLLELKNPKATIQPTAFTQSKRNPFMVFNPDASEKAGAPIFTNVSNQTAMYNLPKRNVLIGTASQLSYYMNAPNDRLRKIRNVIVAGGGSLSRNDIDNILGNNKGKRNNTLLWVGAAIAGAAGLVATK